jgi:hypothetical protein
MLGELISVGALLGRTSGRKELNGWAGVNQMNKVGEEKGLPGGGTEALRPE